MLAELSQGKLSIITDIIQVNEQSNSCRKIFNLLLGYIQEAARSRLAQDDSCPVIQGPCSAQQPRAPVRGCSSPRDDAGGSTGHPRGSWLPPLGRQHVAAEGMLAATAMGVQRWYYQQMRVLETAVRQMRVLEMVIRQRLAA